MILAAELSIETRVPGCDNRRPEQEKARLQQRASQKPRLSLEFMSRSAVKKSTAPNPPRLICYASVCI